MNKKLINNINFICKSNFVKSVNHFVIIINFLIKAMIILLLLQNTFAKNRLSFFQKNISTSKALMKSEGRRIKVFFFLKISDILENLDF